MRRSPVFYLTFIQSILLICLVFTSFVPSLSSDQSPVGQAYKISAILSYEDKASNLNLTRKVTILLSDREFKITISSKNSAIFLIYDKGRFTICNPSENRCYKLGAIGNSQPQNTKSSDLESLDMIPNFFAERRFSRYISPKGEAKLRAWRVKLYQVNLRALRDDVKTGKINTPFKPGSQFDLLEVAFSEDKNLLKLVKAINEILKRNPDLRRAIPLRIYSQEDLEKFGYPVRLRAVGQNYLFSLELLCVSPISYSESLFSVPKGFSLEDTEK